MDKIKVVMLGNQGTGKTSLVLRCLYDTFHNEYQGTIGIDFMSHSLSIDGQTVRLQIWDTAGQERFRSLVPSYIRDSRICLLVYDVCCEESFNKLQWWMDMITREKTKDNLTLVIVGNKIDKEDARMISTTDACAFARANNCLYRETSAKTGHNAKDVFVYAARKHIEQTSPPLVLNEADLHTVSLGQSTESDSGKTSNGCLC